MLHNKCGSRLKQQYICAKEGTVVEKDEIVKGYEFSKDQYVLFSAEELKALEEKATNTIDIVEFVPLATVDRIYLEKVYYLGPDKGGERAYGCSPRRSRRPAAPRWASTPPAASSTSCWSGRWATSW